jgi:hypothetical protein
VDGNSKIQLGEGNRRVSQVVSGARRCRDGDQNMFLGAPWARVRVEAVMSERKANIDRGKHLGQPDADIVRGNLNEENRIRCIGCTVRAHLRQEDTWDDEQQRQEEVAKGECRLGRVVVQADHAAHVPGMSLSTGSSSAKLSWPVVKFGEGDGDAFSGSESGSMWGASWGTFVSGLETSASETLDVISC